jgi:hypothetical protein
MPKVTQSDVITRCSTLRSFWNERNNVAFPRWYKLIEMVDELKQDKMESFVGNDPRAMFNMVLHLLDQPVPHRVANADLYDYKVADAAGKVGELLDYAWMDNNERFRRSGPRQSLNRYIYSLLLATGWYSVFAIVADDGESMFIDPWNPAEVYPMWDNFTGLSEVSHEYTLDAVFASLMAKKNGWLDPGRMQGAVLVQDYWWIEYGEDIAVWNAVLINSKMVKCEPTRFRRIPVYVGTVGGLPDMGVLSASTGVNQWKQEIGQALIATNENIYRTWNKWWTFSLQILRDTAQPRVIEKSASGKAIVKAEDLFRRGAILRLGMNDDVHFMETPPIPIELRTTQADLEAMMQRGGVSWGMYGDVQANLTAYVMSQIAASANQMIKPFHQGIINLISDIDNDWIADCRERGVRPYGYAIPAALPAKAKISAEYEVEIPGEMVQKATISRMVDPDFRLSYTYVINKLWKDVKDPVRERARTRQDQAERDPRNATIAYIAYCEQQAALADSGNDIETAKLYRSAADAARAEIQGAGQQQEQPRMIGNNSQSLPPAGPGENVNTPV